MSKSTRIILILAILIMVSGISFVLFTRTNGSNGQNNNVPVNNTNAVANLNTNTNINGSEGIDTSDWLTYRNEEYGFEIRYPSNFKLKNEPIASVNNVSDLININFEMPKEILNSCNCSLSIIISPNTRGLNIQEWMRQKGLTTPKDFKEEQEKYGALAGVFEQKEIIIDGRPAIDYDRGVEGGGSHRVMISFNDKFFTMIGNSERYVFNNSNEGNIMRKYFDVMAQSINFLNIN